WVLQNPQRGSGLDALDLDRLAPPGMVGGNRDMAARQAQPLGEDPHQLCIRRAVHGRRGEPDLDGIAVAPRHGGRAGARDDVDRQRGDQARRPARRMSFNPHRTNSATSGVMSNIPSGGTKRRSGSINQSVSAYTGRIQRAYRNQPSHDATTRTMMAMK